MTYATSALVLWLGAVTSYQSASSSDSGKAASVQQRSRVRAETTFIGMRGRYAAYRVAIRNDRGVSATGRLLQPPSNTLARRFPAVLLEDGRELNSGAINFLPTEFGDVVVLSLDYPEDLPYELRIREIILQGERLRRASRRITPMFALGADYLVNRSDVDSTRLAIVASSFAVPFAVKVAATDTRFVNVGLVYGAGNMAEVLAANLAIRPAWLRNAAAWIAMRPFAEF